MGARGTDGRKERRSPATSADAPLSQISIKIRFLLPSLHLGTFRVFSPDLNIQDLLESGSGTSKLNLSGIRV